LYLIEVLVATYFI